MLVFTCFHRISAENAASRLRFGSDWVRNSRENGLSGAFFVGNRLEIRLETTENSARLWNWLGEYVLDDEELRPAKDSEWRTTIGEFVEGLLSQDKCATGAFSCVFLRFHAFSWLRSTFPSPSEPVSLSPGSREGGAMGNLAGTQCPPWGSEVAMRDAYEAMEVDHDIELTPAYEYHKLEPENADQELIRVMYRGRFLSGS